MSRPRDQHYQFAHRVLPHLALSSPAKFLLAAEDPGWIGLIWERVGDDNPRPISPKGLSTELREVGQDKVVLVTMPTARFPPEAILAAVVVREDKVRYFVLELGEDLDGNPNMMHCEWSTHGEHSNFGEFGSGRDPDPEAFLQACLELL